MTLLVLGFMLSYFFASLYSSVRILFFLFCLLLIADYLLLFTSKGKIRAQRILPDKLSNGDENPIQFQIGNEYLFPVSIKAIDEIPFQFQKRDFEQFSRLKKGESKTFQYHLRPTERGTYSFGSLNVFAESNIGFLSKRYRFDENAEIPVYPSFLQLRKYDLIAFTNRLHQYGLKKIRRIGHTMEFEQIKEYVQGDDIRNINWKATAKKSQLMVNQYQDEKSQPIYSIIDKGRVMKMPFDALSLLDYAINATLVISNIAIKKQDKAGMLAFSN